MLLRGEDADTLRMAAHGADSAPSSRKLSSRGRHAVRKSKRLRRLRNLYRHPYSVNRNERGISETFVHEPLDLTPSQQCVRLLQVLACCKNDIQCEMLVNVRLSEQPRYTAVSYEWGSEAESEHITTNEGLMKVRSNLYHLLQTIVTMRGECSPAVASSLL